MSSRAKSAYCPCGRPIDYGPDASMCRRCALDHVSGLPDIEVHGHMAVQVILSGGRLMAVALVVIDEETMQKSRADIEKLQGIDIVV